MRMRRKKNLQSRLDNCRDYAVDIVWETLEYGKTPEKHIINYEDIFSNENPVELEIGCGKGQFAVEIAKRNPDKNFLAVEINENVIVQAMEKAKKDFVGGEIAGKTLGVIGLGAIGVMVANAAVTLGMEVIGYDPFLSVDAALRLSRSVNLAKTQE